MELIVITLEKILEDEALAINRLFSEGLETLHLRKPHSSLEDLRLLLMDIDVAHHQRIVLHDHFRLAEEFNLKGVHLNRRNPTPPAKRGLSMSKSCHTWSELEDSEAYNYVFLSPIFNSISKAGYARAFTEEELIKARNNGTIHRKVYALGGISLKEIKQAATFGFGGVAVLGSLWQRYEEDKNEDTLLQQFNELKRECNKYNVL
ncbi:thiamine phosphate synthase [Bacteroides sp. 51]|uniref:thiamine phosphate synthase n=1 Tax=Bacteroides sp. 51 TaxID=2302938 RepID=UPI0013D158B0|nr:thiamine phosphate synthase [Bacteroides sp. 51]NDV84036.1 thiamine phosphate synthase [Bacteroides sp. 51]